MAYCVKCLVERGRTNCLVNEVVTVRLYSFVMFTTAPMQSRDFRLQVRRTLAQSAKMPVETVDILQGLLHDRLASARPELSHPSLVQAMGKVAAMGGLAGAEAAEPTRTGMLRTAFEGGMMFGIPAVGGLAAPLIFLLKDGQQTEAYLLDSDGDGLQSLPVTTFGSLGHVAYVSQDGSSNVSQDGFNDVTLRGDLKGFRIGHDTVAHSYKNVASEYHARIDEEDRTWSSFSCKSHGSSVQVIGADGQFLYGEIKDDFGLEKPRFVVDQDDDNKGVYSYRFTREGLAGASPELLEGRL